MIIYINVTFWKDVGIQQNDEHRVMKAYRCFRESLTKELLIFLERYRRGT